MRKLLSTVSLFLFLTISVLAISKYALPEIVPNSIVLSHNYYIIDYSPDLKDPIWCAEELTPDMIKGDAQRPSKFKPDPLLPGSFGHEEYKNDLKYDRGHQVPAGDMKFSQEAMNETFYTTNIVPQYGVMNQQDWSHLEGLVREWTNKFPCMYIVTGPIFDKGVTPQTIGTNVRIAIPNAMFKVVLVYDPNDPASAQAIGFIVRNEMPIKGTPLKSYAVPVAEVESQTGLKFWAAVPDEERKRINKTLNYSDWTW